jgi:hypothetical protein
MLFVKINILYSIPAEASQPVLYIYLNRTGVVNLADRQARAETDTDIYESVRTGDVKYYSAPAFQLSPTNARTSGKTTALCCSGNQ